MNSALPLQKINLIDPDRFAIAIERDHDAESNRRLSGRDDNDENCEYLAGERVRAAAVLQITRERDEVQIRRVQNQLDRHEDDDDVAAGQHAGHANDEKDCGNYQEL